MNYAIIFGDGALDDVFDSKAPAEIVDCIEHSLERLAENPVKQGYRDITILPRFQLFDFECPNEDGLYRFRAVFHYMENEADLRIVDLQVDMWPR
jgi:hypothetical protein